MLNRPPKSKHSDLFLLFRGILYSGAPNIPMKNIIKKMIKSFIKT